MQQFLNTRSGVPDGCFLSAFLILVLTNLCFNTEGAFPAVSVRWGGAGMVQVPWGRMGRTGQEDPWGQVCPV